ncbi:hypothetical protein B0H19DRAFT_1066469 [Mycena capillaripes]|nr:hypothetical protein B0H19DRAFT_1066469 [Mycena capillaripes]
MSSSPPSTSSNNLCDVFSTMNEKTRVASSPTVAQKRNHAAIAGTGSSDNDNDGVATFSLPNQNSANGFVGNNLTETTIFVRVNTSLLFRRLASTHVRRFKDTPAVCETELLINLLHLSNELGKIVASAPPYEVGAALEVSICLLRFVSD